MLQQTLVVPYTMAHLTFVDAIKYVRRKARW